MISGKIYFRRSKKLINKINDYDNLLRDPIRKFNQNWLLSDHYQLPHYRCLHEKYEHIPKKYQSPHSEVTDIEKVQKAISLDLNNFKVSTTNSFSTMNEVLDSRGSISKGGNKVVEEAINDVKAQMKELKLFVTESTRELNDSLESK